MNFAHGLLWSLAIGRHRRPTRPSTSRLPPHLTYRKGTTNAALYLQRGEIHREHRDWALGRGRLPRRPTSDPGDAAVDLAPAQLLLDSDRPAEAKVALDRFLAATRPRRRAGARARALVRLGRPLEAAADFTRALAAGPTHRARVDFYLERSRPLSAGGAPLEALAGLDAGVASCASR